MEYCGIDKEEIKPLSITLSEPADLRTGGRHSRTSACPVNALAILCFVPLYIYEPS